MAFIYTYCFYLSSLFILFPLLLQLIESTRVAADAANVVTKQTSHDALMSMLWFLVLVLGICLCVCVIYIIRRGEGQGEKFQAACLAITNPIKDAYKESTTELKEKHAQEIRANESNHQGALRGSQEQLRAFERQLEVERADRLKTNEIIQRQNELGQQAYKEMVEVVAPFTQSNQLLAERIQNLHVLLQDLARLGGRL